ncbi:MAG: N-acetyltransferase [Thermodesulfobacteriota bacterium]|nr:MAG: N-acetyltransferase [Thermodesulfobacteriota bacterium]
MNNLLQSVDNKLVLAPFYSEHVTEEYVAWLNNPEVMRFTEAKWQPHTIQSSKEYIEKSNTSSTARLFRILYESNHIGNIRLSSINHFHRKADIAIIIGATSARGQGLATQSINLVAEYAFTVLNLEKLTAGMYANNTASIKSFERSGFVIEATLKSHYCCEGKRVDGILFGKVRNL